MHAHPGTPVGQLFGHLRGQGAGGMQLPPGIPPLSSQVMSPTAQGGSQQGLPGSRRNSPRFAGSSNTQTPIHQTWFMVSDILRLRRGDEEMAAQRVEFEEQQAHQHATHQQELQREFEAASQALRSELGLQAEQQMNYFAQEEKAYFEAHLLSLRAQAETAISSAQRNLQQQFIQQTLEVQARAEAAEQTAVRTAQEHHAQLQHVSSEADQEVTTLRRELQETQYLCEMQAESSDATTQTLNRERELHENNLERQAARWRQHTEDLAEAARNNSVRLREEYEEEIAEGDQLMAELRDLVGELQDDLRSWEDWWNEGEEEQEQAMPRQELQPQEAAAPAMAPPPVTPIQPPVTPPVLHGQIPAQFLPPTSLPCIDAVMPARIAQGQQQQQQQPQVCQSLPTTAPQLAPMTPHSQVTQPVVQVPGGMTTAPASPLMPGINVQAAPVPSGPWTRTREAYRNAAVSTTPLLDSQNIPLSAGVSEASAGLPSQQANWAAGSTAGSVGGLTYPLGAGACPALGIPPPQTTTPMTPSPLTLAPAQDTTISRTRSSLPKLNIKGGDPTTVTRVINEWLQKTAIALNTWSLQASTFWNQAVQAARQQHATWLSLTPAQRASFVGLPTTGQTLPLQIPILEATMRAELLNSVLPDRVTTTAMQKGTLTVLDLLFITLQTYLPSEPNARVDGLSLIEAPLRSAKNFSEALSTLRTWRQQIITVVNDLQGNPEPLKLYQSLRQLISGLVNSDNAFATEVSRMMHDTNIKTHCTDQTLLQLMNLLEIELSARSQEDDEERRRRGQAHAATGAVAAAATTKGKGKGGKKGGKSKDSKGNQEKGKTQDSGKGGASTDKRPVCTDYLTDRGCPKGDQCTMLHPRKTGRCLRCGATGHDLSTCRRPPRDKTPTNQQRGRTPTPKATKRQRQTKSQVQEQRPTKCKRSLGIGDRNGSGSGRDIDKRSSRCCHVRLCMLFLHNIPSYISLRFISLWGRRRPPRKSSHS